VEIQFIKPLSSRKKLCRYQKFTEFNI